MFVITISQREFWRVPAPVTSCKEGAAAGANLRKSGGKAAEGILGLIRCKGRVDIWECIQRIPVCVPVAAARGSVPHSVHRTGKRKRKKAGRGECSLKVVPKIKGRDENNTVLLPPIQCLIHPNVLPQDQHRPCSCLNFLFDSFSCKPDVISVLV